MTSFKPDRIKREHMAKDWHAYMNSLYTQSFCIYKSQYKDKVKLILHKKYTVKKNYTYHKPSS